MLGPGRATYEGRPAVLWQSDTSIKGSTIGIDSKSGDLSASGSVLTTTILEQTDKQTKKKDRVRSTAREIRLGDPFADETTMGPLNNEGTAAKMDAHIADALEREAVLA